MACRLAEVQALLQQHGFEFDPRRLVPTTCHLVTGNTGYLRPDDLHDFDEAVDAFVNGQFYKCGYTAEEIVGKLSVSHSGHPHATHPSGI